MSTRSEPGEGRPDPGLSAIMGERRHLINLAYRLLGSLADAEDAVQETYARWYAMSRQQQETIESPAAWLTKVASRVCLDLLGSARARRERYTGEWIPEPLLEPSGMARRAAGRRRRPGRPGHPRRVGQHGLPRHARIDDPGRACRVHPARCLPLLLR
jgi:DNA-directed RNA polymerase specialized sigma24 family protein